MLGAAGPGVLVGLVLPGTQLQLQTPCWAVGLANEACVAAIEGRVGRVVKQLQVDTQAQVALGGGAGG